VGREKKKKRGGGPRGGPLSLSKGLTPSLGV